jgi:hypothetical protein
MMLMQLVQLLVLLELLTLPPAGAVRSSLFRDSSTLLVMSSALICHGCSCKLRDELLLPAEPSAIGAPLGLLGGLPAPCKVFRKCGRIQTFVISSPADMLAQFMLRTAAFAACIEPAGCCWIHKIAAA